tara:strand:- start:3147 stop:4496 length:1350 start_codon:yes stop_codon:yes gene_type:complete
MADSKLRKIAANIVKQIQEDGNKKLRKELTRKVNGQVLVIITKRFNTVIEELFPTIEKATLKKILDAYELKIRTTLEKPFLDSLKDDEAEKQRFIDARDEFSTRQRRTFVIRTYRDFDEGRAAWKGRKTELNDLIIEHHLENKVSKADKETLDKTSGRDNIFGAQLGHGEGNEGLAVSAVSAAKAKSTIAGVGDIEGKEKLQKIIKNYENAIKVKIDHKQVIENGELSKEYIPTIFFQKSLTNQEMKVAEAAAISQLEKEFDDLANLEGSTTLLDALTMVLLDASASKQRSTGKRKKNISEKGSGTKSSKFKTKREITKATGGGVDVKAAVALKKKSLGTQPQFSPFNLASIINEKLPQTLQKNMRPPRLQNVTGRLARSAKITDVMQTREGFLSFGYTYEKDPYQVFEVGTGSAPWSNAERDPRKLIDKSIREIAANMALGRFYTRRM